MSAAAPPLESLARTVLIYGAALGCWLAATSALRRPLSIHQQAAAVLLWLGSAAVALAHAVAVLREPDGHEVAVSLAYAGVAIGLVPALWPRPDPGGGADAGSAADARMALLAVVATVVVVWRLGVVW